MADGDNTLYEILAVTRDAKTDDIKKAYLELEKKEQNLKDLSKRTARLYAYDILTNTQKRKMYDKSGMKGLQQKSHDNAGKANKGNTGNFLTSVKKNVAEFEEKKKTSIASLIALLVLGIIIAYGVVLFTQRSGGNFFVNHGFFFNPINPTLLNASVASNVSYTCPRQQL